MAEALNVLLSSPFLLAGYSTSVIIAAWFGGQIAMRFS